MTREIVIHSFGTRVTKSNILTKYKFYCKQNYIHFSNLHRKEREKKKTN